MTTTLTSLTSAPSLARSCKTPLPYSEKHNVVSCMDMPLLEQENGSSIKHQAAIDALFDEDDERNPKEFNHYYKADIPIQNNKENYLKSDSKTLSNASEIKFNETEQKDMKANDYLSNLDVGLLDADIELFNSTPGMYSNMGRETPIEDKAFWQEFPKFDFKIDVPKKISSIQGSKRQNKVAFEGSDQKPTIHDEIHEEKKEDDLDTMSVLAMLPDGANIDFPSFDKEENNVKANFKLPTSKEVDMSSEFGEYQPSVTTNTRKRSPVAGRRKSPIPSPFERDPKVLTTSINKTSPPNGLSVMRYKDEKDEKDEKDDSNVGLCSNPKKTKFSLAKLSLEHKKTNLADVLENSCKGSYDTNEIHHNQNSSFMEQTIPSIQKVKERTHLQRSIDTLNREDETNLKTFTKADTFNQQDKCKGESFKVEKLEDERSRLIKELQDLLEQYKKEKVNLVEQSISEKRNLMIELKEAISEKISAQDEKKNYLKELEETKKENMGLKVEILHVENDCLRLEKDIENLEASEETILKRGFGIQKDISQNLATQLCSEVQLLKNYSLLVDEKVESLRGFHAKEMELVNNLHAREIQMKIEQLATEKQVLADHKLTTDMLAKLVIKAEDWSKNAQVVQELMVTERDVSNNDKIMWMNVLEKNTFQHKITMDDFKLQTNSIQKQLEGIVGKLESSMEEIKTMHANQKDHLQTFQEMLKFEHEQSIVDLRTARTHIEEMQKICYKDKEEFLLKCMEERKEIAAEKDTIMQMKEQILNANSAIQQNILDHRHQMNFEAEDMAKQRDELERARVIASDIAHEVECDRHELERQRHTLELDTATMEAFGVQAQQKIEGAMELQKVAAQQRMEAEALNHQVSQRCQHIEVQRSQAQMAQNELLELKRKHDKERITLALERQQLSLNKKKYVYPTISMSHGLRFSATTPSSPGSRPDPKHNQLLDVASYGYCTSSRKHNGGRPVKGLLTSSGANQHHHSDGQYIVENIKASLYLQAQEDFLAEANRVLRDSTQATSNLLSRCTSSQASFCSK